MLLLGNKYAITHLEDEARFRLHHDYPQDLMTWDALFNKFVKPLIESHDTQDVAFVIGIAHKFQLYTILPAAYSLYITKIEPMVCASLINDPKFHDSHTTFFNRANYFLTIICLRGPKSAVLSDTLRC